MNTLNILKTRFINVKSTNPYRNLALEEILVDESRDDTVTLYLWQNDHTIVIGRNQDAWRECKVGEFEADGGHIARRLSGGGAVYHDMGNQNFTFIANVKDYDVERHTEVIRRAARLFGIDAVRSGRNDILADERKFSGNAFYRSGDKCYHHGTILINTDMTVLAKYLNPSPEKLQGKGIASVKSRVVNLAELSGEITTAKMVDALTKAFEDVYETKPEILSEEAYDTDRLRELTKKYASREWRLGEPKPYTARYYGRLSFGEIDIRLNVIGGRIDTATVYSDANDATLAPRVAAAINELSVGGLAFDEPRVASMIASCGGVEAAEISAKFASLAL